MKPEVRARLEQEAELISRRTKYKDISDETGLSVKYISNFIRKYLRGKGHNVAKPSS